MNATAIIATGNVNGGTGTGGASKNQARVENAGGGFTLIAEAGKGENTPYSNVSLGANQHLAFKEHNAGGNTTGSGTADNPDATDAKVVVKARNGDLKADLATVPANSTGTPFSYSMDVDGDYVALVAA
jgi:hypothetical protein